MAFFVFKRKALFDIRYISCTQLVKICGTCFENHIFTSYFFSFSEGGYKRSLIKLLYFIF